jgi:hypothetical protein
VLEGQVDGRADQGRGEDYGADLELEGVVVPGVVVEEDAADVSCSHTPVNLSFTPPPGPPLLPSCCGKKGQDVIYVRT